MALSDARYTAQLMKLLDFEKVRAFYSIDTYRVPKRRKDEICMNFGNYSKYISRVFDTREKAANDRQGALLQLLFVRKADGAEN